MSWTAPWHCGTRPMMAGESLNARIVGGAEAEVGQFPWQAQIFVKKDNGARLAFLCGGTLIDQEVVVTAAHCFR